MEQEILHWKEMLDTKDTKEFGCPIEFYSTEDNDWKEVSERGPIALWDKVFRLKSPCDFIHFFAIDKDGSWTLYRKKEESK